MHTHLTTVTRRILSTQVPLTRFPLVLTALRPQRFLIMSSRPKRAPKRSRKYEDVDELDGEELSEEELPLDDDSEEEKKPKKKAKAPPKPKKQLAPTQSGSGWSVEPPSLLFK